MRWLALLALGAFLATAARADTGMMMGMGGGGVQILPGFLLLESGAFILLESGAKICLEGNLAC